jgi:hypothetical protein
MTDLVADTRLLRFPASQPRLIDAEGGFCELARVLHGLCGDRATSRCDAGGYLVRNLGYIEIGWHDGVARCRLRPLAATATALRAAARWLASIGGPVKLHLWVKGWMQESYESGAAAVARIEAFGGLSTPERPKEAILTQRRSLDRIFGDDQHKFLPLLLRWRIAGGRLNQSFAFWLSQYMLGDRLTIAEISPDRPGGVVRYMGPALTFYGRDVPYSAIGQAVESLPNKDYAGWVAKSYADVANSNTPLVEDVDALITEPSGDVRRSRYERLILPYSDGTGRRFVAGVSLLNPQIEVPLYS